MDLMNPDSMTDGLNTLTTEPGLRQTLVERSKQRLNSMIDERALLPIKVALESFRQRRLCWGRRVEFPASCRRFGHPGGNIK